jgi:uncharacterized membrane protein YidH (DUF202 family)
MTDFMPFSAKALASLPNARRPSRYTRTDNIPDVDRDEDGQQPAVRDYHAINNLPAQVRVPKKVATTIKVEAKVWFANERTWVSYLNVAILIGTLALALFNASKDPIARAFAYVYAAISVGITVYGYLVYQHRITLIRRRDPSDYVQVAGPLIISACLFIAVLSNFVLRVRELKRQGAVIPSITSLF